MAITDFQRDICRLIARNRIERSESYVAGGVALNTLIDARRISRDIDLFHDTREALNATWDEDRGPADKRRRSWPSWRSTGPRRMPPISRDAGQGC